MDGDNRRIYDLNQEVGLNFKPQTQLDYLHFFFYFVRGYNVWLQVAEILDDIPWRDDATQAEKTVLQPFITPLTYRSTCQNGLYTNSATFIFQDALFEANVVLAPYALGPNTYGDGPKTQKFHPGEAVICHVELIRLDLPVKCQFKVSAVNSAS